MKAIVVRELGGAEKLKIEEVTDPRPGPGEVIVALAAAALNHRDLFILQGRYPNIDLPVTIGSDGAGRVIEIGEGVEPAWLGREVVIEPGINWGAEEEKQGAGYRILGMPDNGTLAEKIRIPAINLQPKPAHLSFEEAAALPLAGLTAWRAVVSRARLRAGETVLVTGIGGGVALMALQIARHLGGRVFVTSGSDEKIERARALGAEGGVNYNDPDWGRKLTTMSDGGPDVVIDSAGGSSLETAVRICKPAARIVFFGATTGLAKNLDLYRAFFKQLTIMGSTMGSPREFAALVRFYDESHLAPVVDRVFPLPESAAALAHMESGAQFGKIVLGIS